MSIQQTNTPSLDAGYLIYERSITVKAVLLMDSREDQAEIDRHHSSPMMEEIAGLRGKQEMKPAYDNQYRSKNGYTGFLCGMVFQQNKRRVCLCP